MAHNKMLLTDQFNKNTKKEREKKVERIYRVFQLSYKTTQY